MSKVILVLGATGMIGHNLYLNLIKSFDKANVFFMTSKKKEIIKSYNFYNIKCGFYNANFFNFDELYNNIKFINADFVINCCGITKKKCTSNNEKTIYQINVKLPHYLSSLALKENFKLIHLSSDCVFSGKKGNYEINDPKDAQDLYGISKAKSEVTNSNTLILRKSTIGLELSENHGLLEWFLNLDIIAKGYRNAIFNTYCN